MSVAEPIRPSATSRLWWPHRALALAVFVGAAGALSGCVVVQPWQRGRLAERHMQIPPTKGEAYLDQHVATSKEAAAGGAALEGGGCGCN